MAGSLAWYLYTADNGVQYGVQLDEDTALLAGTGFVAFPAGNPATTLPSGWKMRYVNAAQTSGTGAGFRSRRVYCATTTSALFAGTTTTFTLNELSYSRTSTRGESQRTPNAAPTGLQGPGDKVGEGLAPAG